MEATHKISAVYVPGTGEVDLTWEDLTTGEGARLTARVDDATGEQIAKTVMPCVYSGAVVCGQEAKRRNGEG